MLSDSKGWQRLLGVCFESRCFDGMRASFLSFQSQTGLTLRFSMVFQTLCFVINISKNEKTSLRLLCDLALMRLGVNTVCLAAPASHPTTGTTAPAPGSIQDWKC